MLLANPISPDNLLSGSGAIFVLALILFAECGLLIGFFLPGDTLLFAAGIYLAVGDIKTPLAAFLVVAPVAAFLGNIVGYGIGYRAGPVVFDKPDSRIFRPEFVTRSSRFFERFGSWTVIIGRFVPVVRTIATVMAGVARMRFATYALYSAIGGILWTVGIISAGYGLGHVDFVQRNKGKIDYVILAVVVIGLLPVLIHFVQGRRHKRA